eukprot:30634_1
MIYLLFLSLSSRLIYGENPSESGGGSVSYSYNVMVNMAENLADEDVDAPTIFGWQAWTNKNDPYVQIYAYGTGDEDTLKVKTTTILEGTETPQWDETFVFDDDDTVGPYTKFLFKVWDDDSTFDKDGSFDWLNINDPDFLGETRQILVDQITNCVDDFEFRLPVIRDDNECGLLVVEITKDGCISSAGADAGSEEEDAYGDKDKQGCLVGDIMYSDGDSIGIIGYTCNEYSDTTYIGTEQYCKKGKIKEKHYNGDCEEEYSGSKCCQEREPGTIGGAVCITRDCVEWDQGNECFNAGDFPFCVSYTPDGCNRCSCEGACTLMACENGGEYGDKKACIECEIGYNLSEDGQKCECGKNPGDDCETNDECCDHMCVEISGRKQCWLE